MLLSEMFGVERNKDFMVEVVKGGPPVRYRIRQDYEGVEYLERYSQEDGWQVARENRIFKVIHLAPSGIIHLPPPLTDNQIEHLKAILTLGGRWLAKDANLCVYAYSVEPEKNRIWNHWVPINYNGNIARFPIYRNLDVCSLVSWSDAEPYDISKALGIKR